MQNDKLLKYKVWESSKGKKNRFLINYLCTFFITLNLLAVYNAFSYRPIEPCCCC